jgi:hypothetical protein
VDKVDDELIFVEGHQKEKDVGRGRRRVRMRKGKGKMEYKTSKGTGSLCELKPTSAKRTFQSACGPLGINVVSAGNDVLIEYEYQYPVCKKPISGPPHWHWQSDMLLRLASCWHRYWHH